MSTQLREGMPPLPARMKKLPIDHRGYVVPWFVARPPEGELFDFRLADPERAMQAMRFGNCWVCGEVVGRNKTFVIGPMCAVNRTTSEPPCHIDCARFSAIACPFLTLPKAKRNERGLPENTRASLGPPEAAIQRNPGVTCLWTTLEFRLMKLPNGILYRLGDPEGVEWYAQKRTATRAEILESIDSGMPILQKLADEEGGEAPAALSAYYQRMLPLLPVAA